MHEQTVLIRDNEPHHNDFSQLGAVSMARWPRNYWTTIFTYAAIFIAFPLLCYLAYWWVRG
jgi:hypothetical protein